jgi:hypothetical protein
MTDKFLLLRIKDILFNPIKAWEIIYSEEKPIASIRNGFLLPLILLTSVSAYAGSLLFTNAELSPVFSVFIGLKCFIVFYITVYLTAYILKEITYPLDLGKNFAISFKLIVYSIVPLLLIQVISRLFDSLIFINILSLYSLYVFWTGAEKFLSPPSYKKMPLLIATVVTFVLIFVATDLLFTTFIDRFFHVFFSN